MCSFKVIFIDGQIYNEFQFIRELSMNNKIHRPDQDRALKKHPVDVFSLGASWRAGIKCCTVSGINFGLVAKVRPCLTTQK